MSKNSLIEPFYTSVERYGNYILYRGIDEQGLKVKKRIQYKPTLYVESKDKNSKYKTMLGEALEPVKFGDMRECGEFVKVYKDHPDFNVYGNDRHITSFIQEHFPNEIHFRKELIDIASLDIETEMGKGFPDCDNPQQGILTICVKSNAGVFVWGLKPYDASLHTQTRYKGTIRYFHYKEESYMLRAFLEWWKENTPDVITGWNVEFFDMPYLASRIVYLLGEDELKLFSPWKNVKFDETFNEMGQKNKVLIIMGLPILDYMALFKKFALNTYGIQESYKLDFISELVLGEHKLDYSEYKDLKGLYEQNFQLFVDYNIRDVELVDRLEEKLGMIYLVFTMAYMAGVNYSDTLGTTAIWDTIIFRTLMHKNIIIPPNKMSATSEFEGGYVKEVKVGMHEWVMSFDLNSLYPNIIAQWNISPETIVPHMKNPEVNPKMILESGKVPVPNDNLTIAANGTCYRKDIKGIVPELIEDLYNKRVAFKKEMLANKQKLENLDKRETTQRIFLEKEIDRLNTLQMAIKILMNSLYGAMGSKYFRYYNVNMAQAITLTGQLVNQWAEKHVNAYVNKFVGDGEEKDRIIAMDTDSLYLVANDVIKKYNPVDPVFFLDQWAEKGVEPILTKTFKDLNTMMNCYSERMAMKREVIADRGVWTAKKRYILRVHNSEGVQYAKPKLKIVGIEAIKSSTPKFCRNALKEIFEIIMDGDERKVQDQIEELKTEFRSLKPSEIGIPRGLKNMQKYTSSSNAAKLYEKGTPIHVRAGIMHNWYLKTLGLNSMIKPIMSGDKIKFLYLKTPNPIKNENVIGFIDEMPSEFELSSFIDYDLQFEKTFLKPLMAIIDAIGWKTKRVISIENFFV